MILIKIGGAKHAGCHVSRSSVSDIWLYFGIVGREFKRLSALTAKALDCF